jgi:hypothetical protein
MYNHFMNSEQIRDLVDDCPSCITGDFSACDVSEETKAKVLAYLAEHSSDDAEWEGDAPCDFCGQPRQLPGSN